MLAIASGLLGGLETAASTVTKKDGESSAFAAAFEQVSANDAGAVAQGGAQVRAAVVLGRRVEGGEGNGGGQAGIGRAASGSSTPRAAVLKTAGTSADTENSAAESNGTVETGTVVGGSSSSVTTVPDALGSTKVAAAITRDVADFVDAEATAQEATGSSEALVGRSALNAGIPSSGSGRSARLPGETGSVVTVAFSGIAPKVVAQVSIDSAPAGVLGNAALPVIGEAASDNKGIAWKGAGTAQAQSTDAASVAAAVNESGTTTGAAVPVAAVTNSVALTGSPGGKINAQSAVAPSGNGASSNPVATETKRGVAAEAVATTPAADSGQTTRAARSSLTMAAAKAQASNGELQASSAKPGLQETVAKAQIQPREAPVNSVAVNPVAPDDAAVAAEPEAANAVPLVVGTANIMPVGGAQEAVGLKAGPGGHAVGLSGAGAPVQAVSKRVGADKAKSSAGGSAAAPHQITQAVASGSGRSSGTDSGFASVVASSSVAAAPAASIPSVVPVPVAASATVQVPPSPAAETAVGTAPLVSLSSASSVPVAAAATVQAAPLPAAKTTIAAAPITSVPLAPPIPAAAAANSQVVPLPTAEMHVAAAPLASLPVVSPSPAAASVNVQAALLPASEMAIAGKGDGAGSVTGFGTPGAATSKGGTAAQQPAKSVSAARGPGDAVSNGAIGDATPAQSNANASVRSDDQDALEPVVPAVSAAGATPGVTAQNGRISAGGSLIAKERKPAGIEEKAGETKPAEAIQSVLPISAQHAVSAASDTSRPTSGTSQTPTDTGTQSPATGTAGLGAGIGATPVNTLQAAAHGVAAQALTPGTAGEGTAQASISTGGTAGLSSTGLAGTDSLVSPMAHTTLQATPTVLEVGVPGGTHGWLKIRAEIGEGGTVQASMSAATREGQETLRRELPAMNAFLDSEHVPVSVQVAHGVSGVGTASVAGAGALSADSGFTLGSSMSQDQSAGSGRGEAGTDLSAGADGGRQGSGGTSDESSRTTSPLTSVNERGAISGESEWAADAISESGSGYGSGLSVNGGSWLNVMA